jgi:hypothetical protein
MQIDLINSVIEHNQFYINFQSMWSDVNFYIESTSLASMQDRFSLMINLIAGDWVVLINVSHCIEIFSNVRFLVASQNSLDFCIG